jgi:hypothetical protein
MCVCVRRAILQHYESGAPGEFMDLVREGEGERSGERGVGGERGAGMGGGGGIEGAAWVFDPSPSTANQLLTILTKF